MIIGDGTCYGGFSTSSRDIYDVVSRALQEGGELYRSGLKIVAERTGVEEDKIGKVMREVDGLIALMNSGEISGFCVVQRRLSLI